jgi:protoporphyrin/coproporphyrin ferrochelatase
VTDAVLLLAFGGPTAPADVRPFLDNVVRGRPVPPARLEAVAHHYAAMPGGRSPLNERTEAQARALAAVLAAGGRTLPVFVGMRFWHPYFHEALAAMRAQGAHRALAIILSSLRTEVSWDRYREELAAARAAVAEAPAVTFAPPFGRHPRFLDAVAARAGAALAEVPEDRRRSTPVVFTAHSVPVAMAERSPYVEDFAVAAAGVAARLGHARWCLAYQSRSGRPEDPWLEPDILAVLRELGAARDRDVVVVPLGFVCDHVEVLYDLDVEARAVAAGLGVTLHRAGTVNDHPDFIGALAEIVRVHVAGEGPDASAAAG